MKNKEIMILFGVQETLDPLWQLEKYSTFIISVGYFITLPLINMIQTDAVSIQL